MIGPKSALTRSRLLVVDDHVTTLSMIAGYLRSCGHAVMEAFHAEEALDCLDHDTYDAILCDIHMPGISGLDLAVQLCDDAPHSAVILMTGDPDDRMEGLAHRSGAIGYLRKPFAFSELNETLARVLDRDWPASPGMPQSQV